MTKKNTEQRARWGMIGFALTGFMLLSAMGLNILFCIKTAEEVHINAQRFSAAGAVRRIEYATDMGKPIERFYGAPEILSQLLQDTGGNIIAAGILNAEQRLLYKEPSTADFAAFSGLASEKQQTLYLKKSGVYYTEIPLTGGNTICLLSGGAPIQDTLTGHIRKTSAFCIVVLAVAGVFLFTLSRSGRLKKKLVVAVLLMSQLSMGIFLIAEYSGIYSLFLSGTATVLERVIGADIKHLAQYGILPMEYTGFDEYLADISDRIPEILTLSDAAPAGVRALFIRLPHHAGLYATLNETVINQKMADIAIETVVMAVIAILLTMEFLFLAENKQGTASDRASLRMLFFVPYMGVNMAAAFVTVVAYRMALRADAGGILAAGLPATAEMSAGIAAIILSGTVTGKLGYTRTISCCLGACAAGAVLSGASGGIYAFAAARAVTGFGFSLFTMTGRLLAASQKNESERASMLSMLTSGTMTGYCCGAVVGGLLSDRFSFAAVFYLSAAVVLAAIPALKGSETDAYGENHAATLKRMTALFCARDTAGYLLLIILPIYAGGMFVSYSLPILGAGFGLSTTMTAGLLMLNSLLAAYLMPFMTKHVLRLLGARRSVRLYGVAIALTLGLFSIFPHVAVLVAAAVILGIADSFGYVMAIEGFYTQKSTSEMGGGELMTGLTLTGKAGQAAAPTLLSAAGGSPALLAAVVAGGIGLHALLVSNRMPDSETSERSL